MQTILPTRGSGAIHSCSKTRHSLPSPPKQIPCEGPTPVSKRSRQEPFLFSNARRRTSSPARPRGWQVMWDGQFFFRAPNTLVEFIFSCPTALTSKAVLTAASPDDRTRINAQYYCTSMGSAARFLQSPITVSLRPARPAASARASLRVAMMGICQQ